MIFYLVYRFFIDIFTIIQWGPQTLRFNGGGVAKKMRFQEVLT